MQEKRLLRAFMRVCLTVLSRLQPEQENMAVLLWDGVKSMVCTTDRQCHTVMRREHTTISPMLVLVMYWLVAQSLIMGYILILPMDVALAMVTTGMRLHTTI